MTPATMMLASKFYDDIPLMGLPDCPASTGNDPDHYGFMQLSDAAGSTADVDQTWDFSNVSWDGIGLDFTLSAQRLNATAADDSSRLSAYDNVEDACTYLDIRSQRS